MDFSAFPTSFYFAPTTDNAWNLNLDRYATLLQQRWPGAGLSRDEGFSGEPQLGFDLALGEHHYLHGFLTAAPEEGLTLTKSTPADAATVLAWFLPTLPPGTGVKFNSEFAVEEGNHDDWPLPTSTDHEQLAATLIDHLTRVDAAR